MNYLLEMIFSDRGSRIVFILVGMVILRVVLDKSSTKIVKVVSDQAPRGKRLRTLTNIFNTFFAVAILVIGLFMILKELGFDITPLLTSAGIVGLAVGFGAQALVKDVISGFFLILEGQFDEGDEVEINGKKGVVEKISLRTVSIRGAKKELHIIPNGSITLVSNFSKD